MGEERKRRKKREKNCWIRTLTNWARQPTLHHQNLRDIHMRRNKRQEASRIHSQIHQPKHLDCLLAGNRRNHHPNVPDVLRDFRDPRDLDSGRFCNVRKPHCGSDRFAVKGEVRCQRREAEGEEELRLRRFPDHFCKRESVCERESKRREKNFRIKKNILEPSTLLLQGTALPPRPRMHFCLVVDQSQIVELIVRQEEPCGRKY